MHILPLFVTVGCICTGGVGVGGPNRDPTLHFSGWAQGQEHIWFPGCSTRDVRVTSQPPQHTHTHTLTHRAHLLPCSQIPTCAKSMHKQQKPAHWFPPTQTNKQTHLLLPASRSDNQPEGGKAKQNRRFNLHDSSLLYISTPWQW